MTTPSTYDQKSSGIKSDPMDKVRQQTADASETIKNEAGAVADQAKQAGKAQAEQQFEKGKAMADEQLDSLSSAVDGAAQRLQEDDHPLASYASDLSTQVTRLSSSIQDSSLDEVAGKAYRLARENPGAFALGSVALGIVVSRFVIASDSRRNQQRAGYERNSSSYRSGSEFAGSDGSRAAGYPGSAGNNAAAQSRPGNAPELSPSFAGSSTPDIGRPDSERAKTDNSTLNRTV